MQDAPIVLNLVLGVALIRLDFAVLISKVANLLGIGPTIVTVYIHLVTYEFRRVKSY